MKTQQTNVLVTDVLVIGAGPSGTVAASMVHKLGWKVQVVEKQQFPRFVIGESLLPRCMEHLEAAGFMDALKAENFQVKTGARFLRGDEVCEFDFSEQFSEGWKWTWQVPRADFDWILAKEAEKMGIPIHYKTGVIDVEFDGTDSLTTVEDNEGNKHQIKAKFIIDSSGWGRVIPRLLDLVEPSDMPPRCAMFAHVKDSKRPEGEAGEKITFVIHRRDIWIWIIPFSNGNTSIGLVGNPAFFDDFSGEPEDQFRQMLASEPHTKDRFEGVEIQFKPHKMTQFAASVKQLHGPGFVLTGNSAEFLDPVFSSGVTFATESGLLAAKLAGKFLAGETVDWEADYSAHMEHGIETFRSYVNSWYDGTLQDIFFATQTTTQINDRIRKQICSVLAGYVWDKSNPYVKRHKTAISTLQKVIQMRMNP